MDVRGDVDIFIASGTRDGMELDRSLRSQWMGRIGFERMPLVDVVLEQTKMGERIFVDLTTLPDLAPELCEAKSAWL